MIIQYVAGGDTERFRKFAAEHPEALKSMRWETLGRYHSSPLLGPEGILHAIIRLAKPSRLDFLAAVLEVFTPADVIASRNKFGETAL